MDYLQVNYGKTVANLHEIGFHFVKHQLFTCTEHANNKPVEYNWIQSNTPAVEN